MREGSQKRAGATRPSFTPPLNRQDPLSASTVWGIRFGTRKKQTRRRRKKREKNAEEANRQRREQKETSKTHPGESTEQFCEHHTLSEVICLEKDVLERNLENLH